MEKICLLIKKTLKGELSKEDLLNCTKEELSEILLSISYRTKLHKDAIEFIEKNSK